VKFEESHMSRTEDFYRTFFFCPSRTDGQALFQK
jgi:hypothetical protein